MMILKKSSLIAVCLILAACDQSTQDTQSNETSSTDITPVVDTVVSEVQLPVVEQYDAETFFKTTSFRLPSGNTFSADNGSLLISSDESGVFNAYRLDIASGSRHALTESNTDATYAVSYFADGERILFTADQGGNELNHIFVRAADGDVTDLTAGENIKASFLGWSNDQAFFYILSNARDGKAFDLYCYSSTDYESELVYTNDQNLQVDKLSRDGRWLALTNNDSSANSNVFLVDLNSDDKTPQLITEHEGDIAYGVYDFTPESEALVIATNEHGEFNQAWRYDLVSGESSELVAEDWDVSFVSYSPSGKYRVVGINNDGTTQVSVTERSSQKDLKLRNLPVGDLQSINFSEDESQMAFILNGDTVPSNIFTVNVSSNQAPKQLTQALNPVIDEEHLVEGQVVRYPSFDQLAIPGILYKPLQATTDKPVPAIVWVHGGPGGQNRKGYRAAIQHLVNHGYAVFAMNNRGSSGYGKTFFHMDDKQHGESDLQDVVYARRYLETLDWVDGDKVGIMGGSYGGYMVAAALAFEPEAFDVGINIFGVTNWVRTLQSIPPWWEAFKKALYDEMGDPATDAERHRRISPLFHASNIVKPLLVVQGANDPRVLQVESDELVEAVRANGTHVEYIVFPDEGHGFRRRDNRITASNAYVAFLDEFLKGSE